jgi:CBS domain-containing protein
MQLSDVLDKPAEFLTPGHTVEHAARRMLARQVSLVPICRSDGTLVGVLDERDIVVKAVALSRAPELCALGEIMRKDFPRCAITDEPASVYARMVAEGVERLLVVDRAGKLVGIAERGRLSTVSRRPTARRLRRIA